MKGKKTFNLMLHFVLAVFFITLISGVLTTSMGFLLIKLGGLSVDHLNPFVMLLLFFAASIIIGTACALMVSKKSFKQVNMILEAVSEIGKGNFNIELKNIKRPEVWANLAENINQMARELRNVEIMRTDFIHNFSHEFKTPIMSIQGFAKRLLTKDIDEEKRKEYLGIILEESKRLSMLSANTLFMSKLDSMERIGESKQFMLDEQIRRCVLMFEKQWHTKNIELDINLPEIQFYGNEELLTQVWLNLISNAIKFTSDKGKISIIASVFENGVIVSVSDNGVGMDDEILSRIFDKYYQGDSSHATEGNGLGLSISKKIVSLCGGNISIKSTLGKGTIFTVTLPNKIL